MGVMWGQVRGVSTPPAFPAQRLQDLLPSAQPLSFLVLVPFFKGEGAGGGLWPTHLPLLPLQLPYLIDGAHKITQSNAILRYIARKHNLCEWGWGRDAGEQWHAPCACLGWDAEGESLLCGL